MFSECLSEFYLRKLRNTLIHIIYTSFIKTVLTNQKYAKHKIAHTFCYSYLFINKSNKDI